MMKRHVLPLMLLLATMTLRAGADWRQFRGTDGRGASDARGLPTAFDAKTGENVAWKASLPGRGPSSPIVVGNRVFVTCSSGFRQDRLHVLCFDTAAGKRLWHRQLWATGHTLHHAFGAIAAPTPASDGRRVFAFYSSNDLACFDLEGNLLWFRGLSLENPTTRNDVGMSSSPLALGDVVVVQLENQGESFAAGIDVETGKTRWRIEREHDASWCSPIVLRGKTPERDVLLLQSRSRLTAHDPRDGRQLWQYDVDCNTIASATTWKNRIYLPANGLHCLEHDGDRGAMKFLWRERRLRSASASPVVEDGRAYTLKSPGILVCGDANDGRVLWQLRLKGPFWATPVLADGHLFAVNHDGLVQVVRLDGKGKLVEKVQMDPAILASPAVADGALYFRSDAHLWKIAFP